MSDEDSATDREVAAARAAIRAFVRTHHPDVGGDPDSFVSGLAERRAALERARRAADRRRRAPLDRGDAPIEVVVRPGGLRGLVRRLRDRRVRRRRGPRVI